MVSFINRQHLLEKIKTCLCKLWSKVLPLAKFLVPDWRDIVGSGIELSYRHARLHMLAGRYDNPMPELTISPSQGPRIRPQTPRWKFCHMYIYNGNGLGPENSELTDVFKSRLFSYHFLEHFLPLTSWTGVKWMVRHWKPAQKRRSRCIRRQPRAQRPLPANQSNHITPADRSYNYFSFRRRFLCFRQKLHEIWFNFATIRECWLALKKWPNAKKM
jgi:hypothetical protein